VVVNPVDNVTGSVTVVEAVDTSTKRDVPAVDTIGDISKLDVLKTEDDVTLSAVDLSSDVISEVA
jgi:hypothetical protein